MHTRVLLKRQLQEWQAARGELRNSQPTVSSFYNNVAFMRCFIVARHRM